VQRAWCKYRKIKDRQEMVTLPDAEVQMLDEAMPGFAAHHRRPLTTYAAYEKWATHPYEGENLYEHDRTTTGCQADCQACAWERTYPGAEEDEAYEAEHLSSLRVDALQERLDEGRV